MSSIDDSVHALLKDQIRLLNLGDYFKPQAEAIYADNGSEIGYVGLRHDINKIKSSEGVDILWIEEAQSISNDSWRTIVPTIRREASEIWASWNVDLASDATYQFLAERPPDNALTILTTYKDNPYFPAVLEEARSYLERVDPDAHANIWLGEPRQHSDAQILAGKYFAEAFTPQPDWSGPYYGLDFGSTDPTAAVKCWIHGRTLYVEREAWKLRVDDDQIGALLDEGIGADARRHVIRADSARPSSISYLQRHGFSEIIGATKGPGSVEGGVAHLRSYEKIVVHPQCVHFLEECRLYSYKVDKLSGNVLTDIGGKHDHLMDATRYALEPLIQGGNFEEWMRITAEQAQRDHAAADDEHLAADQLESPRPKPPAEPDGGDLYQIYRQAYERAGLQYLSVSKCRHCDRPLQPGSGYVEQDGRFHEECFRERSTFNTARH